MVFLWFSYGFPLVYLQWFHPPGEGFDPRLGGVNTGAAFGIGCYFTTVAWKMGKHLWGHGNWMDILIDNYIYIYIVKHIFGYGWIFYRSVWNLDQYSMQKAVVMGKL